MTELVFGMRWRYFWPIKVKAVNLGTSQARQTIDKSKHSTTKENKTQQKRKSKRKKERETKKENKTGLRPVSRLL